MKKIVKSAIATACAAALFSSVFTPVGAEREVGVAANGPTLWSTYNSYVVLQDPEDMQGGQIVSPTVLASGDDLLSEGLSVDMYQGESEGAQLVITPKTNVAAFNATASDLKRVGGEEKISAENVRIYKQHYAYVGYKEGSSANLNEYIPFGMYPDMLLPMEAAVRAGENTIEAGKNQALTVDVTVGADEGLPAGNYKGEITLTIDGSEQKIPLNVRLRDIVKERSYMISTAASAGGLSRKGYEMLLDYHICPQFMPQAASSPEDFVRELRRYWNDPNFTNYEIPNTQLQNFYQFARAIALASIEDEVNYFERAVMYMQNVDEPHDGEYAASIVKPYITAKTTLCNELKKELVGYDYVKEGIMNIPFIIANDNWYKTLRAEDFNTDENPCISFACAIGSMFKGEEVLFEYVEEAKDSPILCYANGAFPHFGMALPSPSGSMRLLGWSCARWNLDGHLWWDIDCTQLFNPVGEQNAYYSRDYYNDLNSFAASFGDGSVMYPAKYYGEADEWYASIRMQNYRDGADDFDLLVMLEKAYEDGLLDKYGLADDYDFDDLLEWVYQKGLSTTATYYADDGSVAVEMRKTIMDLLELASSPLSFVNGGVSFEGAKATYTFYADAKEVKADGKTVSGLNGEYKVVLEDVNTNPSFSIVLTDKNGEQYTFEASVFEYGKLYNAFEVSGVTAENVTSFAASSPEGGASKTAVPAGTVTYNESTKTLSFKVESATGYSVKDSIDYSPEFSLKASFFGKENIFDVYYVTMKIRVKLLGDPVRSTDGKPVDSVPLAVNFVNGYAVTRFNSFVIGEETCEYNDGWYERTISFQIDRASVSKADSLRFDFTSYHTDKYNMGALVEVSDIYFALYPHKVQA